MKTITTTLTIATRPTTPTSTIRLRKSFNNLSIQKQPAKVGRKPLGQLNGPQLALNLGSPNLVPKEPKVLDIDTWYTNIRKITLLAADHKEELLFTLRASIRLVGQVQQTHATLSSECETLVQILTRLTKHVEASYSNDTWFERSPPITVKQTLRRLNNSMRASSTTSCPLSSQLINFINKFTTILSSL